MTIANASHVDIPDFADPATFAEEVPHAAFDHIRSLPGLYWQPTDDGTINGGFWIASRFADIVAVESRTADVTSQRGVFYPLTSLSESDVEQAFQAANLIRMDPPEHGRVRRVAAASFGPRVVARFDGWVRDIVDETLDRALPMSEFDWVADVAKYIPSRVVARVLGVPDDRVQDVVDWTDAIFEVASLPDAGAKQMEVAAAVFEYAGELQQAKLKQPDDDMATVLAHAVEAGSLTQEEYLMYFTLLMIAGYETTHTLIGQAMRLIVEDDAIRAHARESVTNGSTGPLVDEFLRFVTPAMHMARVATTDFELSGTKIRKDDLIQLLFVAGNRDPEVFNDPHTFNPNRAEAKALAFGSGPHRCIGNALAKLELRILFEQLAARGVSLELNGTPRRGWSAWINQLHALPVRVREAAR